MAILAALTSRVCPSLGSARQTLVAGNAWCPRFKPCRSRILAGLAHFSQAKNPESLTVLDREYPTDSWMNIPPSILAKTVCRLHLQPGHPLNLLKARIEDHFEKFSKDIGSKGFRVKDSLNPIVTVEQNFDDLFISKDHPGRRPTDTYYVNEGHVLRTHTSAHQREALRTRDAPGYLVTADVYRKDEIDTSHYPVFHQMEGIYTFDRANLETEAALPASLSTPANVEVTGAKVCSETNPGQDVHTLRETELVGAHLRTSLECMVRNIFDDPNLRIRWNDDYFPFTAPSWEMEVWYQDRWMELCGCGVMKQEILDKTGNESRIGWAFGFGLERIAMVLYGIPDIRLFWSMDERFHSQFKNASKSSVVKFQPYSKYPSCYKDISFWCPESYHENEFSEVVREVAGDRVETVALIDKFTHPKTKRTSRCYRIQYRAMDRTLTNEEVDSIQESVRQMVSDKCGVELRG